ncbi:DUF6344 domain-containing protein [Streptomyces sp. NPDC003035]|uniref:DUF6344 domain-containing protein n=1 Tax=Streptomyces sp. NPDC003035 TaxID=3364676 RepID=UPI0036926D7E
MAQALLAGLVAPSARTEVLARLQSTLNAGLAVGAGIGGLALHAGTRHAYLSLFALDAAGFLLCALVLRGLPSVPATPAATAGEPRLAVLRDRPYALLTLLNALLLLRLPLLSLALPLWIVERTTAPGWIVSALFVLNTAAVMLLQVRTARAVTGLPQATRAVGRSGAVMLASCAVFAVTGTGLGPWTTVAVLGLGAVLQVAAEMRHSAGSWQIGFALAPAGRIGQYQGFYGTGVPVARTLGPLLVTTLLVSWGTPGWLVLGAIFLLAAAATRPAVRWARGRARRRPPPTGRRSSSAPAEPDGWCSSEELRGDGVAPRNPGTGPHHEEGTKSAQFEMNHPRTSRKRGAMATAKVKQFWTAFISVLFALLASVGLASTATAAKAPAVQQPEEPASATTGARTTAAVPAQRAAYQWPAARDRALPPTIKQRIRAEAHNSSPSVRHLRADAPVETALADQSELSDLALAATAK